MQNSTAGLDIHNWELRTSFSNRALLPVLSMIAGSVDVTSFLGLGLFSAHVTGNLVILIAHIVAGKGDDAFLILSVPMFMLVLGLTRLLVAGLESIRVAALRPLLLLQFALLGISFILCFPSVHHCDPSPSNVVVVGNCASLPWLSRMHWDRF